MLVALTALALIPGGCAHTWLFTRGRATMQASLDRPFRTRTTQAGQVTGTAPDSNPSALFLPSNASCRTGDGAAAPRGRSGDVSGPAALTPRAWWRYHRATVSIQP